MSSLLAALRHFGQQHALFTPGNRIVVGVSGGPDSLALLHGLVALQPETGVGVHVAHLNHELRGSQADTEAAFVAATAQRWEVGCTIAHANVAELAHIHNLNMYAAGRAARYALFSQVAIQQQAHAVAVAHTANDQAETVLMHVLRGAGVAGLRGMRPIVEWQTWQQFGVPIVELSANSLFQPRLIRPLLSVTRAEIERYCVQHALMPQHDPSNADPQHLRSRVRHTLLPELIAYNPQIIAALGRTAETLAGYDSLVEQLLDTAWPTLVQVNTHSVVFHGQIWANLHPVLQAEALRRAYRIVGGTDTLAHADIERARAATALRVGKWVELAGGVTVRIVRGGFVVGK